MKVASINLGDPVQLGFVVQDARKTSEIMTAIFSLKQWRFEDWPPTDRPEFESYCDNIPMKWKTILAFADFGNMEVELIQNVEGRNGYTEYLNKRGSGIHHLLFEVDDLDAVITQFNNLGYPVKMGATGRRVGTKWVLFDTMDALGIAIEVKNKLK